MSLASTRIETGLTPLEHAQIHVGISNTPFYVTIDTGSSLLWLQSAVDGSQPVADQSTYVPPKSGTAHIADADNEVISYGDGRIVKMRLYNDLVNIAGVIANDQAVGAVATKDMGSSLRQNRANGLLGLGTTLTGSMEAKYRNLAQTLFSEGKIKFPSFSFVGPRNDPAAARRAIDQKTWQQPRGELVVGALPADVQDEKGIVWCPLSGDPPQRWLVKLNSVIINGDEDNPICEDQFALVDSGTSYIITHPDRFAEVQKRLGGKVMTLGDKYEDRFIAFPEQNLKSIQFNFGRQDEDDPGKNLARSFPLGNDDLNLGRDQDNLCISSITTFAGFPFPDNYWILGGIFIDNLVVVFDFTDNDRKIGFASLGPSVDLDTSVSKMENGSNGTT